MYFLLFIQHAASGEIDPSLSGFYHKAKLKLCPCGSTLESWKLKQHGGEHIARDLPEITVKADATNLDYNKIS